MSEPWNRLIGSSDRRAGDAAVKATVANDQGRAVGKAVGIEPSSTDGKRSPFDRLTTVAIHTCPTAHRQLTDLTEVGFSRAGELRLL